MFKPRPRKKSDVVKSSLGTGSNGAFKAPPAGPRKVVRSSGVSKTLEKTPGTQNDTHTWSNDPSPHNLLEYARMPAHCLMEAGSSRSPPDEISPTKALDVISEALADQFLYRFHEDLQSPSHRYYDINHDYADPSSPPSPSNEGDTPDELRTPSTQDTSLANPKSTPPTVPVISSALSTSTQPYAAGFRSPSSTLRSSDVRLGTKSSGRNLALPSDDSKPRHSSDRRHLPTHQDDGRISAQSLPVHGAQPVSRQTTGDQTHWLDISRVPKNGGTQHDPFYRPFTCEQTTFDVSTWLCYSLTSRLMRRAGVRFLSP